MNERSKISSVYEGVRWARCFELNGERFFSPAVNIFSKKAPGRLDVMGGIADYSGSLVLEMPIAETTDVFIQASEESVVRVVSASADASTAPREVHVDVAFLIANISKPDEFWCSYFQTEKNHWASYVVGVLIILLREYRNTALTGLRILIRSSVPEGKGVSSSAAIEVASMGAMADALSLTIEPQQIAVLCQEVENTIAGAACGIMDQMTVVFGRAAELMALRCQPATIEAFVPIPNGLRFWGLDSGIRHAVSGSDYLSVRVGAFMGLKILRTIAPDATTRYLADLTPELFARFEKRLPESMKGLEFLDRYESVDDPVVSVEPSVTYAVRQPTAHPVFENARVEEYLTILQTQGAAGGRRLGQLMYESHNSYSACGLGSEGTDLLVNLVRKAGLERGLMGAKISGGGSGGTVVVLGRDDASSAVKEICHTYHQETGHVPYVFEGSSDGMATRQASDS